MLKTIRWILVIILTGAILCLAGAFAVRFLMGGNDRPDNVATGGQTDWEKEKIPEYAGSPYIEINGNKPGFSEKEMTLDAFEHYSRLDKSGRCGQAYANVCPETLPEEERGPIGEVHPSAWQISNYHDLIEGNYLYNRCHLIAFSLAGENANEKNLITGTRYLNTEGMQPFELEVLDYVRQTGNHVLYRVTPHFEGKNLLASGVEMEALSVEDKGEGISFHIYAYNVQPGVIIDYRTGDNRPDPDYKAPSRSHEESTDAGRDESRQRQASGKDQYPEGSYILNTNTHKFHDPSCDSVYDIKEKNREISQKSREQIMEEGYEPCARCKP